MRQGADEEALRLHGDDDDDAVEGAVDYYGRPASRFASGRWRSALFIIGVEIAERSAYLGISGNLISYLTGPLGESTAAAATAVNVWAGVSCMLPIAGALVADSYLGRYRTIVAASFLYLLGLGMLTVSSVHQTQSKGSSTSYSAGGPARLQSAFFFLSLYLVALAQGGHKPCVQAFGADQFDGNDPDESKSRSSFFNWWFFGLSMGATVTTISLNYVQDNVSWVLGFGIPFIFLVLALAIFLLGSSTYRYYIPEDNSKISNAFIKAAKQCRSASSISSGDETSESEPLLQESDHKIPDEEKYCARDGCSLEGMGWLRLLPVWATCLVFAIVLAQPSTFFTKQAGTLDRRIGSKFEVPPASLQGFIGVTIIAFIPVYDRIVVPATRRFTGKPNGITLLQRIGAGLALSVMAIVLAALVEMKRLRTARGSGLIDLPAAVIPMSIWWLIPQYILLGLSDVFTMVGLQEFFYGQVPDAFRSFGAALYLSIFGWGELISGLLVSAIDYITGRRGQSWFSDDLNRAHLDYFYWLLAGLSVVEFVIYLYFARSYVYKKKSDFAA